MELDDFSIASVEMVFPDTKHDFESFKKLLQSFNRTEALIWCTGINCMVSNPSTAHGERNRKMAMHLLLGPEELTQIQNYADKKRIEPTVFFRGQLLELMRWICLFSQDIAQTEDTFIDSLDRRRDFVRACLMASQLFKERVEKYNFKYPKELIERRKEAMPSFRQLTDGFVRYEHRADALGRGIQLFTEDFKALYADCDEKFIDESGLSLQDYYLSLAIFLHNVRDRSEHVCDFMFRADNYWETLPTKRKELDQLLSNLVQTDAQLTNGFWKGAKDCAPEEAPSYNFTMVRNRPILRFSDGRMMIIDPMFLIEKASVGPLFSFAGRVRRTSKAGSKTREPFDTFGDAFEDYACKALKSAFWQGTEYLPERFAPDVRDEKDPENVQIADAILNNYDNAVIFEIKAKFLADQEILNEEPSRYEELLIDKYDDGIKQLARAIKNLQSKTWIPQEKSQSFDNVKLIYPVLFVHDPLFDLPTQTDFLHNRFRDELQPDAEENNRYRLGRFEVFPLILMTIDVFECLEFSLRKFNFVEILNGYHADTPKRTHGLFDYINSDNKFKDSLYINERLRKNFSDLLIPLKLFLAPQVAVRAHERWQGRGEGYGNDWLDWFDAERDILGLN